MRRLLDGVYVPTGLCVDWVNGPLVQYMNTGKTWRLRIRLKVVGRWRLELVAITQGHCRGIDWGG